MASGFEAHHPECCWVALAQRRLLATLMWPRLSHAPVAATGTYRPNADVLSRRAATHGTSFTKWHA
eukprot:9748016-Lingulodinium_polyedra.AAC.1